MEEEDKSDFRTSSLLESSLWCQYQNESQSVGEVKKEINDVDYNIKNEDNTECVEFEQHFMPCFQIKEEVSGYEAENTEEFIENKKVNTTDESEIENSTKLNDISKNICYSSEEYDHSLIENIKCEVDLGDHDIQLSSESGDQTLCGQLLPDNNGQTLFSSFEDYETTVNVTNEAPKKAGNSTSNNSAMGLQVEACNFVEKSNFSELVAGMSEDRHDSNVCVKSRTEATKNHSALSQSVLHSNTSIDIGHLQTDSVKHSVPQTCQLTQPKKSLKHKKSSMKMKEMVDDMKKYNCPKCAKGYTRKYSVTRHILSEHSNNKKFECNECQISFCRKSTLKLHMIMHVKYAFTCTECKIFYTRKCDLYKCFYSDAGKKKNILCVKCYCKANINNTV